MFTVPLGWIGLKSFRRLQAFMDCGVKYNQKKGLKKIVIPSSVESIGKSAFRGCYALESLVIPDSLTDLGEWALSSCVSLRNVEVSDSHPVLSCKQGFLIDHVKHQLIGYFGSEKKPNIPMSVTTIGEYAFSENQTLREIVIPISITHIGSNAFAGSSLESVMIPPNVISIGSWAFANCNALKTVYGMPDSAAQQVAEKHNLQFLILPGVSLEETDIPGS